MPRVFCGNFGFEYELSAAASGAVWQQGMRDAPPDLACAWLGLAGDEDFILSAAPPDELNLADLRRQGWQIPSFVTNPCDVPKDKAFELVPWGWSRAMRDLASERRWLARAPDLDVVRRVNQRTYRLAVEQALQVAPPGAAAIDSMAALERAVGTLAEHLHGWILKADLGMAGRESLRGRGAMLEPPVRSWAEARLRQTGAIVCEPLLSAVEEAGIQFDIPSTGTPNLLGVTGLITAGTGTYRGTRLGAEEDRIGWDSAIATAGDVALRLQREGYFGPLGLDAMRYRDADGSVLIRRLQDLNARFTMGRLALELARYVPSGWCASWLHSPSVIGRMQAAGSLPGGATAIATSPGSILLCAPNAATRALAESHVLGDAER